MTNTSAPAGASTVRLDVPPETAGALTKVTGPGAALSGLTSTTTLAVDGGTKRGPRRLLGARPGQCIVNCTAACAVEVPLRCGAGRVRAPPAQPAARRLAVSAAATLRALT